MRSNGPVVASVLGKSYVLGGALLIASLLCASFLYGQTPVGTLRGLVTDPSGAVVPNATVNVVTSDGQARSAKSTQSGSYEIGNIPVGTYSVTATAAGFATFAQTDVTIVSGQAQQLNIALEILVEKEKVDVQDQSNQVDVGSSNNASSLILKGADLDALPDDPDELEQDLQALAGPSAGPNGGQVYIDGFTAGQLPPKASIREIRVNQNPFSSEFDRLGYGRIEIFTKPGTDKFHGQVSVQGNDSSFNARNPFLTPDQATPYYSTEYMGNIGGPLGKKASFFFDFMRRNINEIAIINTPALDQNLNQIQLSESIANPRTRTNLGPRLDYQVSKNNTLTARYQYFHDTEENDGVGQFSLPSTGYNSTSTEHTLQVSDSQIYGTKVVNETRFQYVRDTSRDTPLSSAPTISVIGAFTGGGSSSGSQVDQEDRYELQNYTSVALGKHFLKFGGRLRVTHETALSGSGFNGIFTFPDLATYQAAEQALAAGATTAPGAVQFSLTASQTGGVPNVPVTVADAGLYIQDEFRWRPNVTLSYGLRFETQNAIHDHADWAPRVAVAWGIDGSGKNAAKTVLRAGFGMFYDRFGQGQLLNTYRYNGVTQQQFIVTSLQGTCRVDCQPITFFPTIPSISDLPAQTLSTVYQVAPRLHSPYNIQTAVSVERQLSKSANLAVSYLNTRGIHQFLSRNVNAPLPGTAYSSGPRPDPNAGNIYQYDSEGIFKQNQLIVNFNVRAGTRLTVFGFYTLNYANSNVSGASGFPTNQYNIDLDYGRAAFATRNRLFFGGTVAIPYGFRLSPFMVASSGSPYNVTVGQDLSGDSLFNDRPAFAANPTGVCVSPEAACHYAVPGQAYTPIPVNYLTGPARFTLNLRLSKTFGFGPERRGSNPSGDGPGPGGHGGPGRGGPHGGGFGRASGGPMGLGSATNRRYSLTFSVNARNVLNRVNLANPIGNLSSPLFGQSNALAGGPFSGGPANRRIELQATFSF